MKVNPRFSFIRLPIFGSRRQMKGGFYRMNNISKKVEEDKWICIPRKENSGRADSYSLKKGKISFAFDGSGKYPLPEDDRIGRMSFIHYSNRGGHIKYGKPIFE